MIYICVPFFWHIVLEHHFCILLFWYIVLPKKTVLLFQQTSAQQDKELKLNLKQQSSTTSTRDQMNKIYGLYFYSFLRYILLEHYLCILLFDQIFL